MCVSLTYQITKMCVCKTRGSIYPAMEVIVELDLKEKIGFEHVEKGSVTLTKGSSVAQTYRLIKSYFICDGFAILL